MSSIHPDLTLGELVTQHPSLARELERRDLDYCCGGARTLRSACVERGLDADAVANELAGAMLDEPAPAWASMGVVQLVDHLEDTHHRYLHAELPRLSALVAKVHGAHGERHPELAEVRERFEELRADLEPHLMKEERVLFPMVRELATASAAPSFHCGSVTNPISVMMVEHDRAGELLAELRRLTSGFAAPADGCASYRACYEGLAQLEADTHLHVHKENNLLFPAVMRLEHRLAASV